MGVGVDLEPDALGPGALAHDPPVMRHVGRLEEQRRRALRVVDPVEGALVVVGVELLLGQILAAPGGHQHEGVEAHRAELLGQRQQARQIAPRSGVVMVELIWISMPASWALRMPRRAESKAPGQPRKRSCSTGSGKSIEMLMRPMPAAFMRRRGRGRDEGAVGRHDRPQPGVAGGLGDGEDVGPQQRLAAGENEDRLADGGDAARRARGTRRWRARPRRGRAAAEARQCAQARLQLRVTSQATTRGALASSAAPAPGLAGGGVGGRMAAVAGARAGVGDAVGRGVAGRGRRSAIATFAVWCGGGGRQRLSAVAGPRHPPLSVRPRAPAAASAPRLWRGR